MAWACVHAHDGTQEVLVAEIHASRSAVGPVEPFDDEFGVCVRAVALHKSSPQQGSHPHARTQRGQSLSHGL